jgi:hypothetical protein
MASEEKRLNKTAEKKEGHRKTKKKKNATGGILFPTTPPHVTTPLR